MVVEHFSSINERCLPGWRSHVRLITGPSNSATSATTNRHLKRSLIEEEGERNSTKDRGIKQPRKAFHSHRFMHKTPNRSIKTNHHNTKFQASTTSSAQHGQHLHDLQQLQQRKGHSGVLLSPLLPPETLNWTTSFLTPSDLLTLGLVSRHLNDHVNLESTWRSAFFRHFFRLDPSEDYYALAGPLFRRSNPGSWKKEYVERWNTIHRWQIRSSNRTISHDPHHSGSDALLYMPDASALLSASLTYGVVSRSIPFTGKIVKGFLDASGLLNGQGIGNPNAEFSPNVSDIALSSSGSTAFVAWGFRNGDVAATIASKIVEQRSAGSKANKLVKCLPGEAHLGKVSKIVFASNSATFASAGGADGIVKIWSTKTARCLWSSEAKELPNHGGVDPCVQLGFDSGAGVVAAAFAHGDIIIWTGFNIGPEGAVSTLIANTRKLVISPTHDSGLVTTLDPVTLSLHCSNLDGTALFVHRNNQTHLERFAIHPIEGGELGYSRVVYDDGPVGPVSSVQANIVTRTLEYTPVKSTPVTSPLGVLVTGLPTTSRTAKRETSYVMAGDTLGMVSIWSLNDMDGSGGSCVGNAGVEYVKSLKRFEAHEDGGVTVIQIGTFVIATGSSGGTVSIWDALTLQPIRSISTRASLSAGGPWANKVAQIVIAGDEMVWSVGTRVVAWKAGGTQARSSGLRITKGHGSEASKGKGRSSKWLQMQDIKRQVYDSKETSLAEGKALRVSQNRAMAQRMVMDELGLDESGAVEYLLMLSREEEETRLKDTMDGLTVSEEEEGPGSGATSAVGTGTGSQVSPPGSASSSYWPTPVASPSPTSTSFPSGSKTAGTALPPSEVNHQTYRKSQVSPPKASTSTSVWGKPLSAAVGSPSSGARHKTNSVRTSPTSPSMIRRDLGDVNMSDEDADLKFAIELSLAEVRSRLE